ncbi:hypothetical protein Cch01nite_06530 [Cellulomonas chitinilytica]|uniref:Pyrrolo-quinoline quinone repeat domain-containing protein n=2 Tax=Cellulomonas chitinilytica TaxID=398759 RepID=A0A919U195_9CELL|nr:hypothetical protein Cch01nite_06530 [Cellulomonas chitinilytica]
MQQIEVDDPDLEVDARHHPHDNGRPVHERAGERDPGGDASGAAPVRRGAGRWLRRWWWLAAVVVLAVAVTSLVSAARDRAYVARIGAVPGLVRPLDGAPSEAWRAGAVPAVGGIVASGDTLVLVSETPQGWVATSHDAASGAVRWTVTLGPPQRAGFESSAAWCASDGGDVGPTLLCLVTRPGVLYSRAAVGETPVRARVVALSASDGHRLGGWDVPEGTVDASRVADDVVLGWVDEGRFVVERRRGVTGEVVWSYRSPSLLPNAGSGTVPTVRSDGDVVVVDDSSTVVLDGADGDVLLAGPRFRGLQVSSVGDHFATWASVGGGHMYDRDGEVLYDVPGLPVQPTVDDGSTGDVVVLDDGKSLSAIDAESGERRWTADQALDVRTIVAHRLLVSGLTHYGVVDAADGQELWSFDVGQQVPWWPISDGSLVIGPAIDDAGTPMLVGLGVQDGTRFWSVSLPSHVQRVVGVGGSLVVETANETVVLH